MNAKPFGWAEIRLRRKMALDWRSVDEAARSGAKCKTGGQKGAEVKQDIAQKDYAAICKEFAHVSLNNPSASKAKRIYWTAKHMTCGMTKVGAALKSQK